jgi:hypothetical protein
MHYKLDLDELELEKREAIRIVKQIVLNRELAKKHIQDINEADTAVKVDRIRRDAIREYLSY